MAGFYPDAPGMRMAWDDDGSVSVAWQAGGDNASPEPTLAVVEDISSNMTERNDEDLEVGQFTGLNLVNTNSLMIQAIIFPELREIDGVYWVTTGAVQRGKVDTSDDTTNGVDGTWTQQIGDYAETPATIPNYRENIIALAVNAARAIRFWRFTGGGAYNIVLHLYGTISPGETPDRLLFIDELTGLEFTAVKDFGDVPRGSAREFQWRLKNNSTVAGNNLTINTIQFTAESQFLASGNWYTHSIGGDAFQSTKQITSLAPEASSALITTRQVIPVNEVLSLHAARIQATHTSLS